MQALIIENKWLILFILEFLAWAMTFFMLYTRYKIQSAFWFKIALILFTLTGVIPQLLLGIVNFIKFKKIDLFTLVIILLIIYSCTIGKKYLQKLDSWAKKKFSSNKKISDKCCS